jgi:hypothetical protein
VKGAAEENPETSVASKIRELNDAFRTSLKGGGRVMLTRGIVGRADCNAILEAVQQFDAFDHKNNPYGENDFGALEAGKDTVFWKIDYYNRDLSAGSEDPSDPEVTARVLTIMLASEY